MADRPSAAGGCLRAVAVCAACHLRGAGRRPGRVARIARLDPRRGRDGIRRACGRRGSFRDARDRAALPRRRDGGRPGAEMDLLGTNDARVDHGPDHARCRSHRTRACATWQSGVLPGWAGVALAAGLALWLPLLPRAVRIVDGLTIGLGGLWLAWAIWRKGARTSIRTAPFGRR